MFSAGWPRTPASTPPVLELQAHAAMPILEGLKITFHPICSSQVPCSEVSSAQCQGSWGFPWPQGTKLTYPSIPESWLPCTPRTTDRERTAGDSTESHELWSRLTSKANRRHATPPLLITRGQQSSTRHLFIAPVLCQALW